MGDTTLEKSDHSPVLELNVEAKIKQELLSIFTNVEILAETMSRVILKAVDRRKQFKTLCSDIDYVFSENIEVIEKRKGDLREIDPSLYLIAHKLSVKMERLRSIANQPDLKSMETGMRRVLPQQRVENLQTNPRQEEQRPKKG
jgi:hypothetical protein